MCEELVWESVWGREREIKECSERERKRGVSVGKERGN